MKKVCINSRDELLILDLDKIAFFEAQGNYTRLTYIKGQALNLNTGLAGVEKMLQRALDKGKSPFVRLGRSLIINQLFLSNINILKQYIVLSDLESHHYKVSVPKNILKLYKEKVTQRFLGNQDAKKSEEQ